jgi:hypothetical protein
MAFKHFHEYLYGAKFKIYTDHKPLIWLLNKKEPHPRLERWMILLSIYQFELIYKPGKDNIAADALSRIPNEKQINENVEDDLYRCRRRFI